ncbi:MAG: hypothetical protein K0S53_755 [Bacteroidetes bacterium]|jgi:hypothetical protein|nr:hypothetical protein [Bacteroidota bacterium]MDF2451527.1 hypothetical protein [Bacteroidota bacterium]
MRQELELMQKIEQYLLGQMPGGEASAFESEIHASKELYEQVELQKQLMKGIQRSAWRQDAVQAFEKYSFMQKLWKWGYIGTSVVAVVSLGYLYTQKESTEKKEMLSEKVQPQTIVNESMPADTANIYQLLNGNTFVINSSRDTIVKTKEGNLIEIPKELFNDTIAGNTKDSLLTKKGAKEISQAKIYTLHFYTPSYKDSLKKWKQSVQDKNYSKALRSMLSSANPKSYLKTSSKEQEISEKNTGSENPKDTMYKAVLGLNMEKIDNDLNTKNSKLYKLKGKIPFINKTSKNKNTILVFDVDNKNKTSIDTAIVIEIVDKLKNKSIITQSEKK